MIITLECPKCEKDFAVDTADTKVKCRHCGALLVVESDDIGDTMHWWLSDYKPDERIAKELKSIFTDTKPPDYAITEQWRSFVSRRDRDCECGKKIKRNQSAYGFLEGNQVTKVVCMACYTKTLPPDEENPINKLTPKIVRR